MRILVVDDEEAGRYLAASILGSAGHDVDTAVDGLDALEQARESRPDVVLSDVLMPRMDGYQLVREWKSDPALSKIPIVFYTASYTDPADERFARDLGVDGFLSKPVETEVLLRVIADAVEGGGRAVPRRPRTEDETEVLREYSERLVRKLEDKVRDLERANEMLEEAMHALGEEVETKRRLITDLNAQVLETKRREEELRTERDFTKRVIETAAVFIIGLDSDLRIRLFSPGAEWISGWKATQVLGEDYFERLVPEEIRPMRVAEVQRLMESGQMIRYVDPILTPDGERRYLEFSATVTVDPAGEVDGVLAFGIDVTDRVTAAAVERTMARIDLAVLLDRPRSEVLDVTCERLVAEFGYPLAFVMLREGPDRGLELAALSGQLVADLDALAGSVSPDMVCPVEQAIAADEVTVVTPEVPDGLRSVVGRSGATPAAAAIPLRAHGVTIGAIGLVANNPRAFEGGRGEMLRRLADRVAIGILVAEGREQVALQSAALESAGNGIVIADIGGTVRWVNPAFSELTGFGFGDAVGCDLFGGAGRDGAADVEASFGYAEPLYRGPWETVRSGTVWRGEFTNTRRDGSTYLEDVTLSPVRDEHGDIRHVVIVKQDLSERRELEQLKSSFTAVVSHELRTPLTSIIGYADILAKHGADGLPPSADKALENLRVNTHRMQDLVERLLEVTQMEAEGVTLDLGACDVGALVAESLSILDLPDGLRVEAEIDEGLEPVVCDADRIGRALGNILDNAVKYSSDGGVVAVSVSGSGDGVAISVSDEGEGMPPERIPGVFDRFTQLDMSDQRRFGGMGIGLFVAYSIIRAHGGTLIVSSEEGSGSTFTLRVPVAGPGGGRLRTDDSERQKRATLEG